MKALYYGDILQVLRDSIATESVDLIYLDPPLNSNAAYNVGLLGESGQRGTWLALPAKAPRQNLHRANRAGLRFPGLSLRLEGLSVAANTIENLAARAIRLYEQEPGRFWPPSGLDCTCGGGSGGRGLG